MIPLTPRRTWFTNLVGAAFILLGGIGSLFSAFALLLAIGKPYANSATDPLGIFLISILPPGTLLAGIGLLLRHCWARWWMIHGENRGGIWQRLGIDGEMLTGRAHHVIYFASAETWQGHPDWARERREEIIARIKSRFREPTPISPPFAPTQWLFQGPPAQSKFLAVVDIKPLAIGPFHQGGEKYLV